MIFKYSNNIGTERRERNLNTLFCIFKEKNALFTHAKIFLFKRTLSFEQKTLSFEQKTLLKLICKISKKH